MLGKQLTGEGRIDSILGESTKIKGEIQVNGSIRVDGEFHGTLESSDTIVVGKTGTMRADVRAEYVTVGGKVYGNVLGRKKVVLEPGAHVEGDIVTTSLVINEGVNFQGGCQVGEGNLPPQRSMDFVPGAEQPDERPSLREVVGRHLG